MERLLYFRHKLYIVLKIRRVNFWNSQSTRRIALFQLFENLICRHTGCQQLLQHRLGFNLLSSFGGLRLGGSLLGLQLCDFFFSLLDLRLLRL